MTDNQLTECGRKDNRDHGDQAYKSLWKSDVSGDVNQDYYAKVGQV